MAIGGERERGAAVGLGNLKQPGEVLKGWRRRQRRNAGKNSVPIFGPGEKVLERDVQWGGRLPIGEGTVESAKGKGATESAKYRDGPLLVLAVAPNRDPGQGGP